MLALAAGTYALRAAGPVLRERVRFPARVTELLEIAAVVLLAAMMATRTFPLGEPIGLALPCGVAVAGVLAWRRAPLLVVVLAAAGVTAGLRLLGVA
ncbi:AzlD domain-containing protein [Nocardia jiangsuensis]|uniref:AzlD domain-containing protein n=1 Tax=Nocardia jiangsuensis TaxID=1691563 RepID=A0ABV8E449_9NOCA